MGIKDIGYGCTVSNKNSEDMLWLYQLSRELGMEFATAAFHNSYYFHKDDNEITNKDVVISNFHRLIEELLKENNPKSWYRAFFNLGLINYIRGGKRMLPCEAGSANFFIEPYGDVYPCNGLEERYWKESMGNIRDYDSFEALWNSEQAEHVRSLVRTCPKNCWMVGTASPVMKKYIKYPTRWVAKNKIKSILGRPICVDSIPHYEVGQDPKQGDLRESGEVVLKKNDIIKDEVVLTEEEMADMLRAD
jgi:radical SAM protein with 4Fe4S-binding SPASM domain